MPFLLSVGVKNKKRRNHSSKRSSNHVTKQLLPEISNGNSRLINDLSGLPKCYGFRSSWFKTIFIYYALNILTMGFLFLMGKWYCQLKVKLAYVRCTLNEATIVLIKDSDNEYTICKVNEILVQLSPEELRLKPSSLRIKTISKEQEQPSTSSSSSSEEGFIYSSSGSDNELLLPKHDDHDDNNHELQVNNEQISSKNIQLCSILNSSMSDYDDDQEINDEATTIISLPAYTTENTYKFKCFEYHEEKFVLDKVSGFFCNLNGLTNVTCKDLLDKFNGYNEFKRQELKKIYGSNNINIIIKNYFRLFIDEAINPFYFFQLFSVMIWCMDDYFWYATTVIIIASLSIIFSMFETRRQIITLKAMADGKGGDSLMVTIMKPNGDEEELCANDLVPGDILLIPPEGFIMPCDAIVTHGSCTVNEGMLTGESIPVHKTALISSDEEYNSETFKRNTLFCGTQIIQTRSFAGKKVSCIVVRTGYSTIKGSLIRSILFPKQVSFSFYKDAVKFVGILFGIAIIGMIYCAYLYYERHASLKVLAIRVLDILTIAVPPALPAAMTVGSYYAQKRLKKKNIFCTSPDRINFAGKLKLLCFDKTGTLTEGGLDLWCVVPFDHVRGIFKEPVAKPTQLPIECNLLLHGMATCHSLSFINGELVGDPLDLKMFESTEWELEEPYLYQHDTDKQHNSVMPLVMKKSNVEIGLIRQFEFTPQLQRMSVIVKRLENSNGMSLFCKGSPEKIVPLCTNIPSNYDCILDSFTIKGYRVLAMAWKPIVGYKFNQIQKIARNDIEKDLSFVGFIVMQNSLKPVTKPVINKLIKGGIRSVMVTGDNMLTAVSVARECNMISTADKTIIVEMSEEGQMQFKLAAHHYEAPMFNHQEPPEQYEIPSTSSSSSNGNIQYYDENSMDRIGILEPKDSDIDDYYGDDGNKVRSNNWKSGDANGNNGKYPTNDAFIDIDNLIEISTTTSKKKIQLHSILDGEPQNYHFVMTGRVWSLLLQHCPKHLIQRILVKGTVFARMSPENKRQLVENFQDLGYCVGMCGDGANDCSALKMAHVGISLSDAEASVAAPFTSKVCDILCVPTLILEGRCALVTSFGMFKYMALYSMVQLSSVLILYSNKTNLSDTQFLFIDLGIITTIAIAMGRTNPQKTIVNKRPMANLLSIQNFVSLLFQIIVAAGLQIFTIKFLQSQTWYQPIHLDNADEDMRTSWESTAIFSISCFQYICLSLAFSKGYPFRQPFYTNWILVGLYLIISILILIIMVYPIGQIATFFQLMPLTSSSYEKYEFRLKLLLIPLANLFLSLSLESIISNTSCLKKMLLRFGYIRSEHLYDEVLRTVEKDQSWPPIHT